MTEFVARLRDGHYQLVSEPCPCGLSGKQYRVSKVDRYGLPLDSVLCGKCGTVRIDPYLDADSLDNFYRELYQELYGRTVNLPQYFRGQAIYGRKIATWVDSLDKPGPLRVLEVGCGSGGAVSVFHERGHQAVGCDYDAGMLQHGTDQGVPNLLCGSTAEALRTYGKQAFDVVYLHHVFEHVGAPLEMLHELKRLLAPGGSILIIVPELEFIDRHSMPAGDALKFFHVAHKFNFSGEGLALLAQRAGFQAERVTPPDLATGWSVMPELWMRLETAASACSTPTVDALAGKRILNRLRRIEYTLWKTQTRQFWHHQWRRFRRHLGEYTRAIMQWRDAA